MKSRAEGEPFREGWDVADFLVAVAMRMHLARGLALVGGTGGGVVGPTSGLARPYSSRARRRQLEYASRRLRVALLMMGRSGTFGGSRLVTPFLRISPSRAT